MTFVNQLYKPQIKILKKIKFLRLLSIFLSKIFFIEKFGIFNNVLIQHLVNYETIEINKEKIKLIGGSEKLYLANRTQFFIEKDLTKWIENMNKNDVFYDIGANVGMFSCLAGKKNIETISFECMNSNLDALTYNIMLNKAEKFVTVVPGMLSNKDGLEVLQHRDLAPGTAKNEIKREKNIFSEGEKSVLNLKTTAFRLDTLINMFQLKLPTKIKIDVDGAEMQVLEGCGIYLENAKEVMIETFQNKQLLYKCLEETDEVKIKNFFDNYDHYHIDEKISHRDFNKIINFLSNKGFKHKSDFGNNSLFVKS